MATPALLFTDCCFQTIGSLDEFDQEIKGAANKSKRIGLAAVILDALGTITGIVLGIIGLTLLGFHPAASYALIGVGAFIPLTWIAMIVKIKFFDN
jgi:hypothetical protein